MWELVGGKPQRDPYAAAALAHCAELLLASSVDVGLEMDLRARTCAEAVLASTTRNDLVHAAQLWPEPRTVEGRLEGVAVAHGEIVTHRPPSLSSVLAGRKRTSVCGWTQQIGSMGLQSLGRLWAGSPRPSPQVRLPV